MAPSSASVMPAATNTASASRYRRSTSRIRKTGIANSRSRVRMFGMVRTSEHVSALRLAWGHSLRSCPATFGGTSAVTCTTPSSYVLLEDATGATQAAPGRRRGSPAARSGRARARRRGRRSMRVHRRSRPSPVCAETRTASRRAPAGPVSVRHAGRSCSGPMMRGTLAGADLGQHLVGDPHVLLPARDATRRPRAAAGRRCAPARACS